MKPHLNLLDPDFNSGLHQIAHSHKYHSPWTCHILSSRSDKVEKEILDLHQSCMMKLCNNYPISVAGFKGDMMNEGCQTESWVILQKLWESHLPVLFGVTGGLDDLAVSNIVLSSSSCSTSSWCIPSSTSSWCIPSSQAHLPGRRLRILASRSRRRRGVRHRGFSGLVCLRHPQLRWW